MHGKWCNICPQPAPKNEPTRVLQPGGGCIQADNFRPCEFSVSFSIQLFETTSNSDHFYRTLHLKLVMATI